MIHDTVARMDLESLKAALDGYQAYVQTVVEKLPRIR